MALASSSSFKNRAAGPDRQRGDAEKLPRRVRGAADSVPKPYGPTASGTRGAAAAAVAAAARGPGAALGVGTNRGGGSEANTSANDKSGEMGQAAVGAEDDEEEEDDGNDVAGGGDTRTSWLVGDAAASGRVEA